MAQSSEADGGQAGRPWPAGSDAHWWRGEAAEPSTPSAEPSAPDAAADATPTRPTVPPTKPPVPRAKSFRKAAPTVIAAKPPQPAKPVVRAGASISTKIEAGPVMEEVNDDVAGSAVVFVPDRARPRPEPAAEASVSRVRTGRRPRWRKLPRRPWFALPALVLLAFAAAFFAWVSSEPFWLAAGHGTRGTATVIASARTPAGAARCQASFVADGGAFTVAKVVLTGIPDSACTAGSRLPAQMVSAKARWAYTLDGPSLNLRWGMGLGLIVLSGLTILVVTGATRFTGWRRVTLVTLSLGAPLLITTGMLIVAY